MAKVLFGEFVEQNDFFTHENARMGITSTDHETALEEVESKIDEVLDRISAYDHVRSEVIRVCPTIKVVVNDNVVATGENPAYETNSVDLSLLRISTQSPADESEIEAAEQNPVAIDTEDSEPTTASAESKKPAKKTSKKDLARGIMQRMTGEQRKVIIAAMCDELGMTKAHASNYYQALKKEIGG